MKLVEKNDEYMSFVIGLFVENEFFMQKKCWFKDIIELKVEVEGLKEFLLSFMMEDEKL